MSWLKLVLVCVLAGGSWALLDEATNANKRESEPADERIRYEYTETGRSDCYGHDVDNVGVTTLPVCKQKCDLNDACRSFQFNKHGQCYLKNYVCSRSEMGSSSMGRMFTKVEELDAQTPTEEAEEEPVVTTAVPEGDVVGYTVIEGKDCNGRDIRGEHDMNLADCKRLCSASEACLSFQFDRSNDCWLKYYRCSEREMVYKPTGTMYQKEVMKKRGDSSTNLALGRNTWQVATDWEGASSRAVDGDENPSYWDGSCSHTGDQNKPYWVVDLGQSYPVSTVSITNRADCCTGRLKNYVVVVTDTRPSGNEPSYRQDEICIHRDPTHRGTLNLTCTRSLTGRYVMIQLQYRESLVLCEVKVYSKPPSSTEALTTESVLSTTDGSYTETQTMLPTRGEKRGDSFTNLALGKNTWQVATDWEGASSRAVDGDDNPSYWDGSCSHTSKQTKPYWVVDLGQSYPVSTVSITNREDCCSERLKNYNVVVTDTRPTGYEPSYRQDEICIHRNPTHRGTLNLTCTRSVTGRYVMIQLQYRQSLTLCEVKVYSNPPPSTEALTTESVLTPTDGSYTETQTMLPTRGDTGISSDNRALGKDTWQITTGWNGASSRAVDGDENTNYWDHSCSHTSPRNKPYWVVDLGQSYPVSVVSITNREDCCTERLKNYDVVVTDTRPSGDLPSYGEDEICIHRDTTHHGTLDLACTRSLTGRYVMIQLQYIEALTLCEVKVYSNPQTSTTPVPSTPIVGYVHLPGTDCNGRDLEGISDTTLDNCRIQCDQRETCLSFQFNDNRDCWLKRYRCTEGEMVSIAWGNMYQKNEGAIPSGNLALRKETWQKSTGWNGASSRAVDGDESTNYWDHSCSHTDKQDKPYWVVDLGQSYPVAVVAITNRADCCSNRLKNYNVVITNNRPSGNLPSYGQEEICIHRRLSHSGTLNLACTRSVTGRYVMIELQYREALTLCEVKVYAIPPPTTEPLTTPVPSTDGYTHLPGTDCPERDLSGIRDTTLGNCKRRCDANKECLSFQFNIFDTCWLKHYRCTADELVSTSTGNMYHKNEDIADNAVNLALGKRTWQRSTGWNGASSRAVDGDDNPSSWDGSCSHTDPQDKPYWVVDLGQAYPVSVVSITNREDCCTDRLKNYNVVVTDTRPSGDLPSYGEDEICIHRYRTHHGTLDLACTRSVTGRYVMIQLQYREVLTLCEVKVYSNASPSTEPLTTSVPSTTSGYDNPTSTESPPVEVSCTVDDSGHRGSDLGDGYVTAVDQCRLDCLSNDACAGSTHDVRNKCWLHSVIKEEEIFRQLDTTLFLKQCIDIADFDDNLAQGKPTWQRSTGWDGASSRAVDANESGNYWDGSCSHTNPQDKPYWVVDLGQSYPVSTVSITNREDCCSERLQNYNVVVTDTRPSGDDPSYGENELCIHRNPTHHGTLNLTCTRSLTGRYVMIQLQYHEALTLCEVKIYSKPQPLTTPVPSTTEGYDNPSSTESPPVEEFCTVANAGHRGSDLAEGYGASAEQCRLDCLSNDACAGSTHDIRGHCWLHLEILEENLFLEEGTTLFIKNCEDDDKVVNGTFTEQVAPPTDLQAFVSNKEVTLSWKQAPNGEPRGYEVEYVLHSKAPLRPRNLTTIYRSVSLEDLDRDSFYTFRVRTRGKTGYSTWSRKHEFTTDMLGGSGVGPEPTGSDDEDIAIGSGEGSRPIIIRRPMDTKVEISGNAVFVCEATGIPPPTITWKGSTVTSDLPDDRFVDDKEGTLKINNVRPSDDGFYTCQATNDIGTVNTRARLIVPAPRQPVGWPVYCRAVAYDTSVEITWQDPPDPQVLRGGNITGYEVEYWSDTLGYINREIIQEPPLRLSLTIMPPDVLYNYKVRLYTELGHGPWSQTHKFRTHPLPTDEPTTTTSTTAPTTPREETTTTTTTTNNNRPTRHDYCSFDDSNCSDDGFSMEGTMAQCQRYCSNLKDCSAFSYSNSQTKCTLFKDNCMKDRLEGTILFLKMDLERCKQLKNAENN